MGKKRIILKYKVIFIEAEGDISDQRYDWKPNKITSD
jgi:hypothetical protein